MIRCGVCGGVNPEVARHCVCCLSPLSKRMTASLMRTWALLLAATVLYIPANLLPMTIFTTLDKDQADTIFSGIMALISSGMIAIGLLVFVASILVPMLKIVGMFVLLLNAHGVLHNNVVHLCRLYRMIAWVGRWSMLDIFIVSILTGLLQFRLLSVHVGHAATAFACVVILTMLASHSFDPRLLWDRHTQDS